MRGLAGQALQVCRIVDDREGHNYHAAIISADVLEAMGACAILLFIVGVDHLDFFSRSASLKVIQLRPRLNTELFQTQGSNAITSDLVVLAAGQEVSDWPSCHGAVGLTNSGSRVERTDGGSCSGGLVLCSRDLLRGILPVWKIWALYGRAGTTTGPSYAKVDAVSLSLDSFKRGLTWRFVLGRPDLANRRQT